MTEQQRAEYMAIVAAAAAGSDNWNRDADRVAKWALSIWEKADALIDDGVDKP